MCWNRDDVLGSNGWWESRYWRVWKISFKSLNLLLGFGEPLKVFICLLAVVCENFFCYLPPQLAHGRWDSVKQSIICWQKTLVSLRRKLEGRGGEGGTPLDAKRKSLCNSQLVARISTLQGTGDSDGTEAWSWSAFFQPKLDTRRCSQEWSEGQKVGSRDGREKGTWQSADGLQMCAPWPLSSSCLSPVYHLHATWLRTSEE